MNFAPYLGVGLAFAFVWFLKRNPTYLSRWFSLSSIKQSIREMNWGRYAKWSIIGIVLSLVLMSLVTGIIIGSGRQVTNPPGENVEAGNPEGEHVHYSLIQSNPWLFLGLIVVSVVMEEWFFRGVIIEFFRDHGASLLSAGLVSVLSWALLHTIQQGAYFYVLLPISAIGAVLVFIYSKIGLKGSLTVHMVYNLTILALATL